MTVIAVSYENIIPSKLFWYSKGTNIDSISKSSSLRSMPNTEITCGGEIDQKYIKMKIKPI